MRRNLLFVTVGCLALSAVAAAQSPATPAGGAVRPGQPVYPMPYVMPTEPRIREVLERMWRYLEAATPAKVIDQATGGEIADRTAPVPGARVAPGDFKITGYEWGVTYAGMLAAGKALADSRFERYAADRLNLIGAWTPYFRQFGEKFPEAENPFRLFVQPAILDDIGTISAAMIKATRAGLVRNLRPEIDAHLRYIREGQKRLPDGALVKDRPYPNTMWLDDLYMSVPALAQMGVLTGDGQYFDDAVRQVLRFSARMFNRERGLYSHFWIEGREVHPEIFWARANGWALMAMVELLDVLPAEHRQRSEILQLLRAHAQGLGRLQSGAGLWHQLLDRNDSYLETSASAMFTFGLARAINEKWIDAVSYGPATVVAWNALTTKVNAAGQVEGACVGTRIALDPVFYYHRPVSVYAGHGYGPVLLAGAEMVQVIRNPLVQLDPYRMDHRVYRESMDGSTP